MVGKRIVIVVIAVLLCSCLNVVALADSVSQYTNTGGYEEIGLDRDIGVRTLPGHNQFFRAPCIYVSKYFSLTVCPHCGATGNEYIVELPYLELSPYPDTFLCRRCTCKWVADVYGAFLQDEHFHLDGNGHLCAFDYGIDYGLDDRNLRVVQFYCSKHNHYSTKRYLHSVFEFNDFWGLRVIGSDDWQEPSSTPALWETPFVPPYDAFATLEPVSVETIGNDINHMAAIVEVVYKGFPYFGTLLTIAIACSFLIVVVKG